VIERSRKTSYVTNAIALVALVASVCYIAASFRWNAVWGVLITADPVWLGIAAASIPAYWMTRALRWFALLRQLDVTVPLTDLYFSSAVALGFATVTPLQSGEVLKVEFLKRHGRMDRFQGYSSFLVERIADLGVVVILAAAGLLLGCDFGLPPTGVYCGLIVVVAVGTASIGLLWKCTLPGRAGEFQLQMRRCAGTPGTMVVVLLLTLVGWALTAAGWHASLLSLGLDISYATTVAMMALVVLVSILTFIPGNIGVGEVGITVFLLEMGQPVALSQAGALVVRLYVVFILVLAGIHLLIWRRIPRTESRPSETSLTVHCPPPHTVAADRIAPRKNR
jgi:uncharacterized membrane protein YbhN (UPF0104 family)